MSGLVGRFRRAGSHGRLACVGRGRERGGMNDEAEEEQRNHACDDRASVAVVAGVFQGMIGAEAMVIPLLWD
ncbi:hypothetical protein RPMA_13825 [Tardiphaga alba]|uniref:MFS transporter n=1 Tax=Tardiphaga alba TaxID=340268 RepID=A0ABX8A7R9_9BRAD|nr:hypothetical protein [Tardiphaga alba]QUS39796.1 hypothetical protein RPMA_13825 [Tardiphaga alba]